MPKPFETKQEEIEYFQRFCKNLAAGSYLKDILEGVPEIIEMMIKNDWGYSINEQINDIYNAQAAARQETIQLEATKKKLEGEIEKLNKARAVSQIQLRQIADQLHGLYYEVRNEATRQEAH